MILSVAMPLYQGEAYLPETLQSILNQSRPPDEVVLSDDGSTDASRNFGTAGGCWSRGRDGACSPKRSGVAGSRSSTAIPPFWSSGSRSGRTSGEEA